METNSISKNIFDFKRFWNHIKFESWKIWRDNNYSLLILAFAPILFTILMSIFSFIFGFDMEYGSVNKVLFFIAAGIVILAFPSRIYGNLTDKEKACPYLMLPVSTTEKYLTMLFTCCFSLPLFFCLGYFGSDWLLSVIMGEKYGTAMIASGLSEKFLETTREGGLDLKMSLKAVMYLNWCENILFFTLGAIFFKKSKIAKTILAGIVIVSIISSLCVSFFGTSSIDEERLEKLFANTSKETISLWFNIIIYSLYLVIFAVLDTLIYLRLKTIEH